MLGRMVHRVALVTPFASPSPRGNAVTVERIRRGLAARGTDVRVWDASVSDERRIEREVAEYAPSVVHGFHAWRVGPLALRLARRHEIPLVVTLTGTDANDDLRDPARAATVRHVLEGAAAVVAFHESVARRVVSVLPDVAGRLAVVPQSVALGEAVGPTIEARWPLPADRVLFVFPAGIRMVKNPRLPLPAFERLVSRDPAVRLLYVGPMLDREEGTALTRALDGTSWARWIGAVPHTEMAALLRSADVVLNCSTSEGGMANSVLEAQALGRAVLASDIEGNRSLVEDDVTGLLFRDEAELERKAERLIRDPALRDRLGQAGRARVLHEFPPHREIDGYLAVYMALTPPASRRAAAVVPGASGESFDASSTPLDNGPDGERALADPRRQSEES
jgi:glycosyltransferase involved in cell wall biosynthesis